MLVIDDREGFKGWRQQFIWSRPQHGHSQSGHHLWLSLPLPSRCVKQHLVWNSSHHESPAALTQIDGNLAWTTGEKERKKAWGKESLFKFNSWKRLKSRVCFCLFYFGIENHGTLLNFIERQWGALPWACGHNSLYSPGHNKTLLQYSSHRVKDLLIPGLAVVIHLFTSTPETERRRVH